MDMRLSQDVEGLANDADATAEELRVPARLIEYERGRFVALPAHTTLELVERPPLTTVPGAPYYCRGLVAWQGRQLPLLDLRALMRAYNDKPPAPFDHVLVLAFQRAPGQPLEYGALCAPSLVRIIEVSDSQQCALTNDSDLWPWISLSCFLYEGLVVPVLDTGRLFAQPHC